jgi:hypothetical protein
LDDGLEPGEDTDAGGGATSLKEVFFFPTEVGSRREGEVEPYLESDLEPELDLRAASTATGSSHTIKGDRTVP